MHSLARRASIRQACPSDKSVVVDRVNRQHSTVTVLLEIGTMAHPRLRKLSIGAICLLGLVVAGFVLLRPHGRPNLLIITLDTTRADRLGCYGYAQAQTPALDALAARGVLFENAFATVPLTLPSHATILTGLYPPEHGLHINGKGQLGVQIPTLAELLGKSGYDTGAFVASFVLHSKFGLNRGFQTYNDEMAGGERHGSETHLMRAGNVVVDAALGWLTKRSAKPFFCWVHLYDPHAPYDAHAEEFGERFRDAPYDGDIAFTDRQVGRLLEFLKARGLDERTVVVVVGDHGESFGEHQEHEHGLMVYNQTIQVPLIVASPDCRAGHRVSSSVSLVDVFPTVLDCLQAKSTQKVSGHSLLGALRGDAIESQLCYAECDSPFIAYGWSPLQCLTTESWKYIKTTREELYDLRVDPQELKNVSQEQPAKVAEMQQFLAKMTGRMSHVSELETQLSEADRRKLQSLGYLSGGNGDKVPAGETLPDVKDMIAHYNAEIDARKFLDDGKFDEAETRLRDVIKAAPDYITARTTLGRVLQKQKRVDEAVTVYEEVLKLKPDNAEAHFDLANVLANRGKLDAAIKHYLAVLETDQLRSMTHINLAGVYAFKGQADLAREHYELGLEEFPDSASAQFAYGMFLLKQGDVESALPHVVRAVELQPKSVPMRYQLGVMLLSMRRLEEARVQLEETLRLDPQHPHAKAQLLRARQVP